MTHPVPALRVQVDPREAGDDTAVVHLAGELDIASGPVLAAALEALSQGAPLRRLVVDLEQLSFVDVVGLQVLLTAQRRVAAGGGQVVLRRPAPLVRRVLGLLDLGARLAVEEDGT